MRDSIFYFQVAIGCLGLAAFAELVLAISRLMALAGWLG